MKTTHAYLQIADELRNKIIAGEYQPGAVMPSTADLQRIYQVSQGTARSAMEILRRQGLVDVPGPGRPTTVRVQPPRIIRDGSRYQYEKDMALRAGLPGDTHLAREVGASDARATVTLVDEQLLAAAGEVAFILGLDPDEPLRRYTFLLGVANTDVRRIAHHYVPESLDQLVRQAQPRNAIEPGSVLWPGGTMYQLGQLGIEPHKVIDRITTRMALPEEAELLGLPDDRVPLLVVRKITIDSNGVAREVADVLMPGDRSECVYRVELKPWPADAQPSDSWADSDSE